MTYNQSAVFFCFVFGFLNYKIEVLFSTFFAFFLPPFKSHSFVSFFYPPHTLHTRKKKLSQPPCFCYYHLYYCTRLKELFRPPKDIEIDSRNSTIYNNMLQH